MKDAFNFSIPMGWNFRMVAEAIAGCDQSKIVFNGFVASDLEKEMQTGQHDFDSPLHAIESLGHIVKGTEMRYTTTYSPESYILTME